MIPVPVERNQKDMETVNIMDESNVSQSFKTEYDSSEELINPYHPLTESVADSTKFNQRLAASCKKVMFHTPLVNINYGEKIKGSSHFNETNLTISEIDESSAAGDEYDSLEKSLADQLEEKLIEFNLAISTLLSNVKESLRKVENEQMTKLRQQHEKNLDEFREYLEKRSKGKEANLRSEKEEEEKMFMLQMVEEKRFKLEELREKMERELLKSRDQCVTSLSVQFQTNHTIIEQCKMQCSLNLKQELKEIKKRQEEEVVRIRSESVKAVERERTSCDNQIRDIQMGHAKQVLEIKEKCNNELERLKLEMSAEIKRDENAWREKLTLLTLKHKSNLRSVVTKHFTSIKKIKNGFEIEEREFKKKYTDLLKLRNIKFEELSNQIVQIARLKKDSEKLRSEKYMLESRYKHLKDRYKNVKLLNAKKSLESHTRKNRKSKHTSVKCEGPLNHPPHRIPPTLPGDEQN